MGTLDSKKLLRKLYESSPRVWQGTQLEELMKVYHDLEKTLRQLKSLKSAAAPGNASGGSINITKLVEQLMKSKRRLERKIGNKILLEREHLSRRWKELRIG